MNLFFIRQSSFIVNGVGSLVALSLLSKRPEIITFPDFFIQIPAQLVQQMMMCSFPFTRHVIQSVTFTTSCFFGTRRKNFNSVVFKIFKAVSCFSLILTYFLKNANYRRKRSLNSKCAESQTFISPNKKDCVGLLKNV